MLFLMRKGVTPTWEDERNRQGGCFSYKINNKNVHTVWKQLSFILVGETISNDHKFSSHVTGITISPKKAFCIIKIWMESCLYQDPKKIKILTVSDHPLSPSGVGTQTKYFIAEMLKTGKFQFISLAIDHHTCTSTLRRRLPLPLVVAN